MNNDKIKTAIERATRELGDMRRSISNVLESATELGVALSDALAALDAPKAGEGEAGKTGGDLWLVWSKEHGAYWGKNSAGYYTDINSAGRYTLTAAQEICRTPCYRTGAVDPRTKEPTEMVVPAPEFFALLASLPARPKVGVEELAEAMYSCSGVWTREEYLRNARAVLARLGIDSGTGVKS